MSQQIHVCAVFGERRNVKSALIYAGRLAALLNAGDLHVYLPGSAGVAARDLASAETAAIQRARVEQVVREWQPSPVVVHDDIDLESARPDQLPPNAIVVANGLAMKRRDLTVLQPFEESHALRADGSILVPFGHGQSGSIAAELAVLMAQAMSFGIIFYHTTWRNADVESDDPMLHLTPEAMERFRELEQLAAAHGVSAVMAVEMADDVVFGMLHCALNGGVEPGNPKPVSLIVMAHGVNTTIGSYVEKALSVSATPILVAGANAPAIYSSRRYGEAK